MSTITAPPLVTPTRTLPLGESAKSPVPVTPVGRGISGPVRNRLMFSSTIEFTPRRRQPLRAPHGTDAGHVTAVEPVPGHHRPAVDRQDADLGQRHAERLDHVAKRRCPITGHPHPPTPVTRREEHPQPGR